MRSRPSPSACERRGYATGAVVGSQVLGRRYGLQRGFDFYDDHLKDRVAGGSGWPERRADQVVDAALALADRLGPRFFLWVHLYDPHMTYDPPAGFASAFSSRPYDGEIAFADAQLGRLLEGLRARWGDAGMLVVVTSDHGESFGEHGDHDAFLSGLRDDAARPAAVRRTRDPGRSQRRRAGGPGGRGSDRARARAREAAARRRRRVGI